MTLNDDRLEVRVDPAFKARLKAAAKADHRSLSSFVISRLEAALSSSETPEARIAADVKRGLAEAGWMREPKTTAASKPRPKAQRKGGKG